MSGRTLSALLAERVWSAAATLAAPGLLLLLRRRVRRDKEIAARLPERRGEGAGLRPPGRLAWLHAASVGETMSLLPLIEALHRQDPELQILVTTGTVTAARLLDGRLHAVRNVRHRFAPLDVPRWIARFLRHWRPDLVVLVESELWPNLIRACRTRDIPLFLVNARLSERSAARWARMPGLARQLLNSFRWIAARGDGDAARLRTLGAWRVASEGDLKLAAPPLPADDEELARLRRRIGDRPVWLAASTHPGEEEAVVRLHERLLAQRPGLLTLLVPRHPDRGADLARRFGLQHRRAAGNGPPDGAGIWLCDTLDELGLFCRLAGTVLVGNSLPGVEGQGGGHNPYEPARLGCAVASGPKVDNFAEAAAAMREAGALAILPDENAIADWLHRMLGSHAEQQAAAERARRFTERASDLPDRLARRLLAPSQPRP